MSDASRLGAGATAVVVAGLLSACGPAVTGAIGVGVDAAGRPVGHLRVCPGEHMDGADLIATPFGDSTPVTASWDARPAATGTTSWSFVRPVGAWVLDGPVPQLKPGVVYHLDAGPDDGSGYTGYVLFTVEDLKTMAPGQVRVYDTTRPVPEDEATGSREQQVRDENDRFMRVITQGEFEQQPCAD